MKYIFLVFLSAPLFSFCQNDNLPFPAKWEGKWVGRLEVFKDTGKVQELPMELHILPVDSSNVLSWTWTIFYGKDKRPYQLITVNASKGLYLIDEKNSIKMEGYYIGAQFYQLFEVMGSRLLTKTEMVKDALIWEIIVSNDTPVSTTGGTLFEEEEIPQVNTFAVTGLQHAVLHRK